MVCVMMLSVAQLTAVHNTVDSYHGYCHITFLWTCFHWHIGILLLDIQTIYIPGNDNVIIIDAFIAVLNTFRDCYVWRGHRSELSTEHWLPLLLLLLLLHCPRRVSTSLVILLHVFQSCTTSLQLTVPIFLVSFFTSTSHLALRFPLVLLLVWFIFLVFLALSFRCRCPFHLSCWSSIIVPVSTSSYNFSSSTFVLIFYWLSSSTGIKIILNILPSKVMHVFPPDSHPPHVLHRT